MLALSDMENSIPTQEVHVTWACGVKIRTSDRPARGGPVPAGWYRVLNRR